MLDNRLVLPAPIAPAAPWRFPVLAVLAPVVVSVALWLVTGSLFALVFAALGPVTALASVGDQWWGGRRGAARERARFEREVLEAREHIARAHARERDALLDAWPDGPAILSRRHDRGLWHADTRAIVVVLGEARIRSSLEVAPPAGSDEEITDIVLSARTLMGPYGVDPRLGIGIVGPRPVALAVFRGIALQLLRVLPPADYWMGSSGGVTEPWLSLAPHRRVEVSDSPDASTIMFGRHGHSDAVIRLALGGSESEIPPTCRVVVVTGPHEARVVQHPDPDSRVSLQLAFVSQPEAETWVARLRDDPRAIAAIGAALPDSVKLASLLRPPGDAAAAGLQCTPAVGPSGPVSLDLVTEGPHAVVAGTTGSGKSELLIAWVIAMAAEHSPERVSFLLIDFKGGSAFAPLASLPHVVGTISDLDEHEAGRALASLRAELRYRETRLAASGVRGIDGTSIPRLVIVADEFAAMLAEFPDLHALFTDIAARGRSLGVHLILCTQRPAGVVKDSLLANADLRLSLRVNNAADSHAVVGTPEASELSASTRGRVVVRRAGADTETLQVGLADAADVEVVRQRWARGVRPRRPWLDPLPADIAPSTLSRVEGGIALGAADLPDDQRQETFGWRPSADGNLLVIGGPRSGKSTALAGIPGIRVPPDPPRAWDVVVEAAMRLDTGRLGPGILVVDDLDGILSRFSGEHRSAWLDLLTRILREGPTAGFTVAASALRLQGEALALAPLLPSTILLGQASRHDWVLAGGHSESFVPRPNPGWGFRADTRIQIAHFDEVREARREPVASAPKPGRSLAIASTRAAYLAAELERGGWRVAGITAASTGEVIGGSAIVADLDEWQSHWGLLSSLRSTSHVILDGCTLPDVRMVTRLRTVPPPLPVGATMAWEYRADNTIGRIRLPIDRGPAVDEGGDTSARTMDSAHFPPERH